LYGHGTLPRFGYFKLSLFQCLPRYPSWWIAPKVAGDDSKREDQVLPFADTGM